jgi:predicted Zn-dependent protease with MMP-like domain
MADAIPAPDETIPFGEAPALADLHAMAEAARDALPAPYAALAAEVRLRVEDWPDDETLDGLGIESAYGLTGLYDGVPLPERSASDPPLEPGTVWLFRRPILDEWADRGDVTLEALVAHVLVHELAHHMGWSDDDIAAIDRWWE